MLRYAVMKKYTYIPRCRTKPDAKEAEMCRAFGIAYRSLVLPTLRKPQPCGDPQIPTPHPSPPLRSPATEAKDMLESLIT